MSDWTPTTEDMERAVACELERLGGPHPVKPEGFDNWLANIQARVLYDAADEAEQTILSGDVAEAATPAPGESGRQSAIDHRDRRRAVDMVERWRNEERAKARQEKDA